MSFLDGISKITQGLWPPIFLGMFGYDLYQYVQFPNNRYRVSLLDLIFGIPRNYNYEYVSLSANLGGDIPAISRLNYWPWLVLFGSALISGLVGLTFGRRNFNGVLEKFEKGTCQKIEAFFSISFSCLNFSSKEDIGEFLAGHHEQRNFFIKIKIIALLADIYCYTELATIKKKSLNQLHEFASFSGFKRNPLTCLYANYQIWLLGKSEKMALHLFAYGLVTPLNLFAQIRLWSLLINKIIGIAEFYQAQQQCHAESKSWRFIPERGNYDCTVCDWDFVDYRSSLTGQGCLTGLLYTPRNPQEILSKLKTLKKHGPFSTLDFSRQAWPKWLLADWQKILQILQDSPFDKAILFNLSRPIASIEAVLPDFLAAVAEYLQYSQVQLIDFERVTLSVQGMTAMLPGFIDNNRTLSLNLTATDLDDDTAAQFLAILPSMVYLQTLTLNNNLLTGRSLQRLAETLNRTAVTDLNIGANFFNATDIEQFSQALSTLILQRLDISGIDFSEVDADQFGTGLMNSTLLELSMAQCEITDSQAASLFAYMARSYLTRLNWAGNQIAYSGVQAIADLLPMTPITHLILDDNLIEDDAVALLKTTLASSNSSLKELSLSGNFFTAQGFSTLVGGLINSTLQTLRTARVSLGDIGLAALLSSIQDNYFLQELDLSQINLTYSGASELFYFIAGSALTALNISGNSITLAGGEPLRVALNGSQLQRLDISRTQITAQILQQALPALPDSRLQALDISDNPLDDATVTELAEFMISPIINRDHYLRLAENDIDFNRALTSAVSQTQLNFLAINFAQISAAGARALCLILPYSNVATQNLQLAGNDLTSEQIGVYGCPMLEETLETSSAGNLLTPNIWPVLLVVVALFILLRLERTPVLFSILDALINAAEMCEVASKHHLTRAFGFARSQITLFGQAPNRKIKGSIHHEVISISPHRGQR